MTQEMSQQIFNEVTTRLDAVAAKLGVAAEHMWPILVRQEFLSGLSSLILIAGFVMLGAIMAKASLPRADWSADPNIYCFTSIVGMATMIISALSLAISGVTSVMHVANPEYYAFKELMLLVR